MNQSELKEEVLVLQDRLRNGVRYDEENNQYILTWTERELAQAQKEADRLAKFFDLHEAST